MVAETLHYPAFPCCLAAMANDCKTACLQRVAFDSLCSYLPCFDASFFYYRAGTATMSELLDAQAIYRQSCDSYVEARAKYEIKKREYLQATGR